MPSRWPAYLSNDLSAKIIAMRVRESEGMKFELKILRVLNGKNSCKQTCDSMQRNATESMMSTRCGVLRVFGVSNCIST